VLSSYIDSLYKHLEKVEMEKAQVKQDAAAKLQADVKPMVKPLEQQLVEYFRTLSQEQLSRPRTMDEITIQLQGKYRDHPHPQLVSAELRKLGFERRRLYGDYGGKRMWFPPA
jgi:hypothetical protein